MADDNPLDPLLTGCAIGVVITVIGAVFVTCSDVSDIKKAVCAEAYARAVTASDSLRVNRTESCDLPSRDAVSR